MDLIERYLAAIGRQLPAKQAADIKAELRDELMTRLEDREAEQGRPLDRREVEALLKDVGHPLVVAGRYRKTQHLIGPEVFPFWWAVLKVVLAVVVVVYLALAAVSILADRPETEFKGPSIAMVLIYLFGLITLVFAAFERFGKTGFLREWKPSRLPPAEGKRRSAVTLISEIVGGVVFLAWWFGLIRFRDYLPDFFLRWDFAPVWADYRWPIAAYYVVEIAADVLALARPGAMQLNSAIFIGRYLAGIAILIGLLNAGHWLVVSSTVIPAHALAQIQINFDIGMRVGIGLTILGLGIAAALEAWRWRRLRQSLSGGALSAA